MPTLSNAEVIEIARRVAIAHHIGFTRIVAASAIDSTGAEAIEITFVVAPGSSSAIMGECSARTVSEVIRNLADAGEDRCPIVQFQEEIATFRS